MLNASVGVQRAIALLRPATSHRSSKAISLHRHSLEAVRSVRDFVAGSRTFGASVVARRAASRSVPAGGQDVSEPLTATPAAAIGSARLRARGLGSPHLAPRSASAHVVAPIARTEARRSLLSHLRTERAVPAVAVAILLAATAISSAPSLGASGPVGGPSGDGPGPRIVAGGVVGAAEGGPQGAVEGGDGDTYRVIGDEEYAAEASRNGVATSGGSETVPVDISSTSRSSNVLDDGTILKPVAVDTTVADGKGLMRSYRVRSGDTLTGIARKFDVSMMTVWWANNLSSKNDLQVGQILTIPPVSGVVVTVGATDSLEVLAAKYGVQAAEIVDVNELDDPNLVIGQTLTIPGALGDGIATPTPAPTRPKSTSGGGGGSSSSSTKPPTKYTGGAFVWPVPGGYISQYYRYGHYGLDIAADRGTPVKAAAAGTVLFAGWKNNGGGYQVWISHGSNLYTTYNHMSGVSVGKGQSVGRGQQVGRVGATGNVTGPHLHFEVWKGQIWSGGRRVNPLAYL